MDREEIIQMAREAGSMDFGAKSCTHVVNVDVLARFAQLVAAKEREACAKACNEIAQGYFSAGMHEGAAAAMDCTKAIRARGATDGKQT